MDTNQVREQFEAAFVDEMCRRGGEGFRSTILHSLSQKKPDGDYQHITESLAWWAWQASREAVVVELPLAIESPPYACFQSGWNDMRGEAVDAIESQGLKVEVKS
ncbi:hypothetical protein [Pseudomonas kurunegalensis]|uniref:hypothetical protein n=1 Tax=Pseudomonas kurunegalensis TaxID=485880 RepID=UPI003A847BDC